MANELNTAQPATGLTVTAQLFKSGITVGSSITCAEIGTTRFYTGNMPAITAGTYQVAFYNSTTPIASGSIAWNGSAEILVNDLSTATTAGTAIAVRSELGVELARIDVATSSRLASASYTTPPTAATNASAVWDELMSSHTTDGTYGGRIVRSTNVNNELQLNAQNHAAANVHQFQAAVIESVAFATSAVTLFTGAMRTELTPELTDISEVHAIHGLDIANALTVTPTQRSSGAITQAITGDGTTNTVVTRI